MLEGLNSNLRHSCPGPWTYVRAGKSLGSWTKRPCSPIRLRKSNFYPLSQLPTSGHTHQLLLTACYTAPSVSYHWPFLLSSSKSSLVSWAQWTLPTMDLEGYDGHEVNLHSDSSVSLEDSLPLSHRKTRKKTVLLCFFPQIFLMLNLFVFISNIAFSGSTWNKIRPFKKYCTEPPYCMYLPCLWSPK